MEAEKHCELFGSLEKIETFSTLKDNVIAGSLVFESLAPFMGYYHENPGQNSPIYVYLTTNRTVPVFDIARATANVREQTGIDFDAAKGFIKFNDRYFNVIRIRHIDSFAQVLPIQEAYAENGVLPVMFNANWKSVDVDVQLSKVFCLNEISKDIYIDAGEKNHYYVKIPKQLTYNEFVELTRKVKNNWMGAVFDAAKSSLLQKDEVKEAVRIYSENITEEDLKEIRKLYLDRIK